MEDKRNSNHFNDGQPMDMSRPVVFIDVPMGVSEWKEHGKKYGYWKFFLDKTCDEILGSVPEKGNRLCRGHHNCKREGEHYHTGPEELAWNRCRQAIESKIRELKGEVEIREIVAGKGRKKL